MFVIQYQNASFKVASKRPVSPLGLENILNCWPISHYRLLTIQIQMFQVHEQSIKALAKGELLVFVSISSFSSTRVLVDFPLLNIDLHRKFSRISCGSEVHLLTKNVGFNALPSI